MPQVYTKIYLLISEHTLKGKGLFRIFLQEQKCWQVSFLFLSPKLAGRLGEPVVTLSTYLASTGKPTLVFCMDPPASTGIPPKWLLLCHILQVALAGPSTTAK